MPRNLSIDKWIQIAKFTQAAGEMAPSPYIKGAAGCVVMILEAIEKAGKNDKDLRALADDIGTTIEIVKETIEAHGISSATHFQAVCADFQTYLENLLSNLDTTQHNLDSKRFEHFLKALKARKIVDTINDYKQRMNNIKSDYIVRGITDLQLEVPVMQDVLSTRIIEAAEMSQLRITSTVESRSDRIIGEIRNLREIQREHTTHICARLQDKKGYYKGMVRDFAPGDVYLIATESHDHRQGYCTVENSNTVKLIRMYQPHIGNEEDIMKQLDHDIDIFSRPRHPNIAQVFGVCRSPNLPAIIFHGSMRVPVGEYLDSIPVQEFVLFYVKFVCDVQSVSNHLKEYYTPENSMDTDLTGTYINEHGRLVVADIFCTYLRKISIYTCETIHFSSFWKQPIAEPRNLGRYLAYISDFQREALTWAYHAICHHVGKNHVQIPYQQGKHYVPGSILTVRGQTLVGGVRDRSRLREWNVRWRGPHCSSENPKDFVICLLSTDCGSIVVDPLAHPTSEFKGNTIPILCAGTVPHHLKIYLRSSTHISKSWIAQSSCLDTYLRSRGYVDEDGLYQIYGGFSVRIEPLDKHGSYHLCDTFLTEDPHTLSLFIRPLVVDYSSHEVSMPVLSWLYDGELEISLEEAEEVFGFKLITSWESWSSPCSSVFTAIPELNAEYGFNPARGGTDVCEQHGWPVLELFDMSKSMELEEWTTSDVVSQSLEPLSTIISEGARQTLREEISLPGSLQGSVKYMAVERIEEVDADEAETKMKIIAAVQRNMYPRYSELLIVVVTAISTLMLTLIVQVYLYQ